MNSKFGISRKPGTSIFPSSVQQLPNYEALRPKVRSCILKLLSHRLSFTTNQPEAEEDELINLIIEEYFQWIGYHHSADMLRKESKVLDKRPSDMEENMTDVVRKQLKLGPLSNGLPIMFTLIHECKK